MPTRFATLSAFAALAAILTLTSCSKSDPDSGSSTEAPKPQQAAAQLEKAFVAAPPDVKSTAAMASDAIKTEDYEKAVVALQAVKGRQNLSLDQGMAIHNSIVAMETKLIAGVAAGDPKAKKAYELLKAMKRK